MIAASLFDMETNMRMTLAALRHWGLVAASAVAVALPVFAIAAESYPEKPIVVLVPFGAGSGAEQIVRALGQETAKILRQPLVIENKPGSAEITAATLLQRAAPNGYTLMVTVAPNAIAPALQSKLPYRGLSDFAAVGSIATVYTALAAGAHMPVGSAKELFALIKSQPDKYTFGSSGVGTAVHLQLEMLNRRIGARSLHVPYRSIRDVMTDLVAGRLDYGFVGVGSALQFANEGKLKVLGVPAPQRLGDWPDLPTLEEQGAKGYEASVHYAIIAPKGTPPEIVGILNKAINESLGSADYKSRIRMLGAVPAAPSTPAETMSRMLEEEQKWRGVAKDLNIRLE
jgi:tripartite-type tricarboxylate transporter receptor subunit TctC